MFTSKTTISLALGLSVSAAALYFAFRNVPFKELAAYLVSINYLWVFPAALLILISFALRAARWQIILGASRKISFAGVFHPLMIGFMLNCVLPGRLGELARPVILQRKEKVPLTAGLATVAAERVFDIGILMLLFAGVLAYVPIDPALEMTFGSYRLNSDTLSTVLHGMLKLSVILAIGIVLVSIGTTRNVIMRAIQAAPSRLFFLPLSARRAIANRVAGPLARMVEHAAAGFAAVKQPKAVAVCAGYSALIWGLQGVSFFVVSLGCPGVDLTLAQATAVLVIICFFIALPSVPGFWGLWEAGGVFALALFGISASEAAGYTLANHAIQMFPVILVGLGSAFVTGINIWQAGWYRVEGGSSKVKAESSKVKAESSKLKAESSKLKAQS